MQRGFTVVEFFAVAAILGIFIAISLMWFGRMRAHAEDVRRIEDLSELQKSLALYNISNGHFPVAHTPVALTGSDAVTNELIDSGELENPIVDVGARPSMYLTNPLGTTYTITFCLGTDTIPNRAKGCDNILTP